MSDPLILICSIDCYSQTIRARELKFLENVHPTPCVMCHMSGVMCHLSPVTCLTYFFVLHLLYIYIFFFYLKNFLQCGGASRRRVCYQWGLPCLVYNNSSDISDCSDSSDDSGRFQPLWQYKDLPNYNFHQISFFTNHQRDYRSCWALRKYRCKPYLCTTFLTFFLQIAFFLMLTKEYDFVLRISSF